MDLNKVLEFLGSKWFVAILALAMIAILPTTYGNLMIVYDAGEMGRLWYIPVVFIMNILAAIMAVYKGAGMFLKKKTNDKQEW